MWTNSELKEKGKISFKSNYWVSVLAAAAIAFFTAGSGSSAGNSAKSATSNQASDFSSVDIAIIIAVLAAILVAVLVMSIVKIVIGYSVIVGAQKVFIGNESIEEKSNANDILFVFKSGSWGNVTLVMFLKNLFISLWSLLLVIPGIIKSYEYRMVPYLLAENPGMNNKEAFAKSKEMMNGNKMKAFLLDLSFIPWFLLGALTCGVLLIFYVNPYYYQTCSELYLTLKKEVETNGR